MIGKSSVIAMSYDAGPYGVTTGSAWSTDTVCHVFVAAVSQGSVSLPNVAL